MWSFKLLTPPILGSIYKEGVCSTYSILNGGILALHVDTSGEATGTRTTEARGPLERHSFRTVFRT